MNKIIVIMFYAILSFAFVLFSSCGTEVQSIGEANPRRLVEYSRTFQFTVNPTTFQASAVTLKPTGVQTPPHGVIKRIVWDGRAFVAPYVRGITLAGGGRSAVIQDGNAATVVFNGLDVGINWSVAQVHIYNVYPQNVLIPHEFTIYYDAEVADPVPPPLENICVVNKAKPADPLSWQLQWYHKRNVDSAWFNLPDWQVGQRQIVIELAGWWFDHVIGASDMSVDIEIVVNGVVRGNFNIPRRGARENNRFQFGVDRRNGQHSVEINANLRLDGGPPINIASLDGTAWSVRY